MTLLNSIPIVVSEHLRPWVRVQVRFPRSRKRRIRKKWSKDPRNWTMQRQDGPDMLYVKPTEWSGPYYLVTPEVFATIRTTIAEAEAAARREMSPPFSLNTYLQLLKGVSDG